MSTPPQDINQTTFSKIKTYITQIIICFSLFFLLPIPFAFLIYIVIFSPSTTTTTTTTTTPPQDNTNLLREVLTETARILKSYKTHFIILSLLFLLPFSMLVFIYVTISPIGLIQIIFIVAAIFFLIFAIGTITYTTFHGYYNKPLELITTIKSLSSYFIPLCSTLIVLLIFIGLIIGIHGILLYSMVMDEFNYGLIVFLGEIVAYVSLIYVQFYFMIGIVISVIEYKWGYEALRRSAYLMKGMKREAFIITVLFGVSGYYLLILNFNFKSKYVITRGGVWMFIYQIYSICTMVLLLVSSLTGPVVLYIYSKKKHGELAMEIQPEEYVSLLIDDDCN